MRVSPWRLVMVGLLLGSGVWATDAPAQPFCWNLSPFSDIVTLEIAQPTPTLPFFVFGVDWRGFDVEELVYQLLGGGTAMGRHGVDLETGQPRAVFGLQLTTLNQRAEHFDGQRICQLDAILDGQTLNGDWQFTCGTRELLSGAFLFTPTCTQVVVPEALTRATVGLPAGHPAARQEP